MWVKWAGTNSNNQSLFSKRTGVDPATMQYQLSAVTSGNLGLWMDSWSLFEPATSLPAGTWTHVAFVYDGNDTSQATLYIDGIHTADTTFTMGDGDVYDAQVGASTLTGGESFNGAIDEVYLYNRPLSQAEVLYLAGGSGAVYIPLFTPAELYDSEPQLQRIINFRDYAIVANDWLEDQSWPKD